VVAINCTSTDNCLGELYQVEVPKKVFIFYFSLALKNNLYSCCTGGEGLVLSGWLYQRAFCLNRGEKGKMKIISENFKILSNLMFFP
jgi:hypothetical protein